jgi:hypothetical protein
LTFRILALDGLDRERRAGICSPLGIDGVRRVITGIVVSLVAAGCHGGDVGSPDATAPLLLISESPAPAFNEVTAGPVRALIPERWRAVLAGQAGGLQQGLIASPRPRDWGRPDGSVEGMAAVWVDVARVGVPSDYYYLAATGPALQRLTHSKDCRPTSHRVIVDHPPALLAGAEDSPGDYVARGQGLCVIGETPTRWAYFVAAPGYGPVRQIGIPSSGLYVVVAVLPDSHRAPTMLDKLLGSTQFAGAGMSDFIAAARL